MRGLSILNLKVKSDLKSGKIATCQSSEIFASEILKTHSHYATKLQFMNALRSIYDGNAVNLCKELAIYF